MSVSGARGRGDPRAVSHCRVSPELPKATLCLVMSPQLTAARSVSTAAVLLPSCASASRAGAAPAAPAVRAGDSQGQPGLGTPSQGWNMGQWACFPGELGSHGGTPERLMGMETLGMEMGLGWNWDGVCMEWEWKWDEDGNGTGWGETRISIG